MAHKQTQRVPKKLRDAVEELAAWLPSETREYNEFIFRFLAALPGGELAEDMGYEPFGGIGWQEADMLGKLIEAIETKDDVEYVIDALLGGEEEDEG